MSGAPVFNFNLPGILVNFWNRRTGMSGYFGAREEGRLDVWLQQNRSWKAGAGIVVAGQSGGQKIVLKHVNFALLGECERALTGVRAHSTRWDRVVRDANRLGKELVRAQQAQRAICNVADADGLPEANLLRVPPAVAQVQGKTGNAEIGSGR